jgi:hypothetical protein
MAPTPLPSLGGSQQRHRPLILVQLSGPRSFVLRDGLIDTGADDVVFPESVAATIGIDLSNAPQITVHLVGRGTLSCRFAGARLRITDTVETYEWDAVIGFAPVFFKNPLLGHASFLQFFDAEFRGADKEVILTPNRTFPGQVT